MRQFKIVLLRCSAELCEFVMSEENSGGRECHHCYEHTSVSDPGIIHLQLDSVSVFL